MKNDELKKCCDDQTRGLSGFGNPIEYRGRYFSPVAPTATSELPAFCEESARPWATLGPPDIDLWEE